MEEAMGARDSLLGARLRGRLAGELRARHHRRRSYRGAACSSSASSTRSGGMPDIDIDFDFSRRRDEMLAYVMERYGVEHTGMVATLNTYHARSATARWARRSTSRNRSLRRSASRFPTFPPTAFARPSPPCQSCVTRGSTATSLEELLGLCGAVAGLPGISACTSAAW